MGKCESATASIGIKILLSDIVTQINETNYNIIIEMLESGHIEDENDFFNEVYEEIIDDEKITNGNYSDIKENLTNEFKTKGTIQKSKFSSKEEHTLENGRLWDKYLLVPIKNILETDRWGYDRYGINSKSRAMNFDLSIDLEKYKDIEKIETVFMLVQNSG